MLNALFLACFNVWAPDRHDDEIYDHALHELPEFAMAPHASLYRTRRGMEEEQRGHGALT